jgi:hypothetical protein
MKVDVERRGKWGGEGRPLHFTLCSGFGVWKGYVVHFHISHSNYCCKYQLKETAPRQLRCEMNELKLSISDKGSWHCLINLSFMRTISRYNNNEIPLTSSSESNYVDCSSIELCALEALITIPD